MTTRAALRTSTLDDKSKAILYEGANLSEMAILFKRDERTLKRLMHGIEPIGKRYNAPIYDVAKVATRMTKMSAEQVDQAIRRLNHADLPQSLTKEFWSGQRSKQEYQLREGDLWPTSKVIEKAGEMVKVLAMELNLLSDGVERSTELTDKQREILLNLVDGAKTNMLKKLRENFGKKEVAAVAAEPEPAPWSDEDEDDNDDDL